MDSEQAGPSSSNRGRTRGRRRDIVPPAAVAGSSGEAPPFTSPRKKRRSTSLTVKEQEIIINIYKFVRDTWPKDAYSSNVKMVEKTAEISGVSRASIYRVLGTYRDTHSTKVTQERERTSIIKKLDNFEKSAIRMKVHQFYRAGELPTVKKIWQQINADEQLPNMSITTLRRVLHHLKFRYIKRERKSVLIDRQEIVLWRTKYLIEIQQMRVEGRRIFYLDETWVNAGHTVGKVWQDTTITSAREAFLEGLSTGAKNPVGKGKRLIVVHIGNEEGFLEEMDWIFESSKTGDYHESMDAPHFEEWFRKVLDKLRSGDVIVMDNASYYSRLVEKIPTMSWIKVKIQQWLDSKQIIYEPTETKARLIERVNEVKHNFTKKYVIDEMAKEKGITVLRLSPYHCELNPIELIWANVKGYVARNNTTFKFTDLKKILKEGLNQITPLNWKNCVEHVIKAENEMRGIDNIIDNTVDRFIVNVASCSSESSEEENSESSDDT